MQRSSMQEQLFGAASAPRPAKVASVTKARIEPIQPVEPIQPTKTAAARLLEYLVEHGRKHVVEDGKLVEYTIDRPSREFLELCSAAMFGRQRNIKPHAYNTLLASLRKDGWHQKGESVSVSKEGHICNGQHRVCALLELWDELVARGTQPQALVFAVTNRDSVELYEWWDAQGNARDQRDLDRAKGLASLDKTTYAAITMEHWTDFYQPSRVGMIDRHDFRVDCDEYVADLVRLRAVGRPSGINSAHLAAALRCMRHDDTRTPGNPGKAVLFFTAAFSNTHSIDGVDLPVVKLLCDRLRKEEATRSGNGRPSRVWQARAVQLCIRAYNHWRNGRDDLTKLQSTTTSEDVRIPFPHPYDKATKLPTR